MQCFKWLYWVCSLSWALPVIAADCEQPIRVFAEDWPPYIVDGGEQAVPRFTGIDVDILESVIARAGCRIQWVRMPPERAIKALAQGNLDLMMAASLTAERQAFAWFTEPYRQEVIGIIGRVTGPAPVSVDDILMQHLLVLSPRHGFYGEQWQQDARRLQQAGLLQHYASYESAIGMLKAGRVDLIMGDVKAFQVVAEAQGIALSAPRLVLHDAPVHFMLSRVSVSEQLVREINRALSKAE